MTERKEKDREGGDGPSGEAPPGRSDAPSLSPQLIAAMTQGLFEFSKAAPEALAKIQKHGFVFDGSGGRWEKLAFTLYSSLVEISFQSEMLIENYEAEVDPEGHAARPEGERLCESMPMARSAPEAKPKGPTPPIPSPNPLKGPTP